MKAGVKFAIIIGFFLVIGSMLLWWWWPIARQLHPGEYKKRGPLECLLAKNKAYVQGGVLERVTFEVPESPGSEKKFVRQGELVVKQGARALVLIAHGYMCSMRDVAFLRWMFEPYHTFVFDFRAHGTTTPEQVCTFGHDEAHDVKAAVEFLHSDPRLKGVPIIAYGFSMGAVAIIEAQAQTKDLFFARILDCPYDSAEKIIQRALANMKVRILGYTIPIPGRSVLEKHAFHPKVQSMLKVMLKTVAQLDATPINTRIHPTVPEESIKKVAVPTFFIHCKRDEKIPVEAAVLLYQNHPGYKRLWLTNGRRHFDSYFSDPEKYNHKIRRFIEKALDGKLLSRSQAKIIKDPD